MDEKERIEYLIGIFEHELEVNTENEDEINVLNQEIHKLRTNLLLLDSNIGGE